MVMVMLLAKVNMDYGYGFLCFLPHIFWGISKKMKAPFSTKVHMKENVSAKEDVNVAGCKVTCTN